VATVPLPNCNGQGFGCRNQVDGNVRYFNPVDSNKVFVVGTDKRLLLEFGPFGQQIPPVQSVGTVPLPSALKPPASAKASARNLTRSEARPRL